MANAIASGAEAGTGMTAGSIAAVKSPDYAKVYFIAMRFGATGIDDQVGVWASNSLEPGQGMIMAVEGMAQQFTDWPTAANSAAEISSADPAVDDAKDCL